MSRGPWQVVLPSRDFMPAGPAYAAFLASIWRDGRRTSKIGGDGGESNSPSRTLRQQPLRACPIVFVNPGAEDRHPALRSSHVPLDRA